MHQRNRFGNNELTLVQGINKYETKSSELKWKRKDTVRKLNVLPY